MAYCVHGSCLNEATHPYKLCKKCYYDSKVVNEYRQRAQKEAQLAAPVVEYPDAPGDPTPPVTAADFVGDGQNLLKDNTDLLIDPANLDKRVIKRYPEAIVLDYTYDNVNMFPFNRQQSKSLELMNKEIQHTQQVLQELGDIKKMLGEILWRARLAQTPKPVMDKFERAVELCLEDAGISREFLKTAEAPAALQEVDDLNPLDYTAGP